ncbi:MAG: SAM hydrolase/SAM-dependent halogenase family protein [Anaerolineae bacterium]
MRIVTLTTDFGLEDAYVGAMKGVILGLAPDVVLVDVSHQVPPQDVLHAALLLEGIVPHYPPQTIHVLVVDPGVGTERRPIAIATDLGLFVGPDNGVLTPALDLPGEKAVVHLTERRFFRHPVSQTFHGRDVFAPVAAHLARGVPLEAMGPRIADPVRLGLPKPVPAGPGVWLAEVIHVDRFGNCITNLRAEDLDGPPEAWTFEVAGHLLRGLQPTYGAVPEGALLALVGSSGRVEVAQRMGHAARTLGLGRGARLVARRLAGPIPPICREGMRSDGTLCD